jgi:GMP synthase (glutamine-hydrolysing)
LPEGATLLAADDTFPNQTFQYRDSVFPIQFYPEIRGDAVENWTSFGRAKLALSGADPRIEQLYDYARHDIVVDRWVRRFLYRFLATS